MRSLHGMFSFETLTFGFYIRFFFPNFRTFYFWVNNRFEIRKQECIRIIGV